MRGGLARRPQPRYRRPQLPRRPAVLTLVVMSGRSGRSRTLRLPVLAIRAALGLGAAAALVGLASGYNLWKQNRSLQTEAFQVATLREQVQSQAAEEAYFKAQASTLNDEAANVKALQGKVHDLLPNATPPPASPAPLATRIDAAQSVLSGLGTSLPWLRQSLDELSQELVSWRRTALTTPSIWPVRGPITSPFGARGSPFGEGTEFHTGLDIAVPEGTPVHVTASGTVTSAGRDPIYGWMVVVDHGGGIQTMYGHNERLAVHAGQAVTKGDTISYAGSTGRSTGPHVHYEVRVGGSPVNPERFLPGGGGDVQASDEPGYRGYGGG